MSLILANSTVRLTPLDGDGKPLPLMQMLDVEAITINEVSSDDWEPCLPIACPEPREIVLCFRTLRYSRATRMCWREIAGITYVQRQRTKAKKRVKENRR